MKTITGYCEPLSLRAGEKIALMAQTDTDNKINLDVVRLECGDPSTKGPGFREYEMETTLDDVIQLPHRPLDPGSWAELDLNGLEFKQQAKLRFYFLSTLPEQDQVVIELLAESGDYYSIEIKQSSLVICTSQETLPLKKSRVQKGRWYELELRFEPQPDRTTVLVRLQPTKLKSPGGNWIEPPVPEEQRLSISSKLGTLRSVCLARDQRGKKFDGRISGLSFSVDQKDYAWDFSFNMGGRSIPETGGANMDLTLHQLPSRGVTGPLWDGSVQDWSNDGTHYDAIHFHSDDLYDAGWPESVEWVVPENWVSGIYAFRLSDEVSTERFPFFLRPAKSKVTHDVALLMPSCTYLAYANHRMLSEGADFMPAKGSLPEAHEYIREHPELGLSCYEKHRDGSGVMFSSRRRPILNLSPGADRWNFTPDTCLNAFLEHLSVGHDVIADEDLHEEGESALAPYKVIVTGTHPEYWSTSMLDALEAWLENGGRLMYLGGNGFYWRVAFSKDWPGAIELRRTEDGVRNWETRPGESYHAFGGEYGGLWRRLGRAPNATVGVGFAAQGFERAIGYRRTEKSYEPELSWIFDGVESPHIGTSGLGGGAAGQEIDRYDEDLGSPSHASILATAKGFAPDMIRTKEDFAAAMIPDENDPLVRADMVIFETPQEGAVFSVGSISWFGALARNDYDNDVAKITENVLRRFLIPEPVKNRQKK